MEGGCSRSTWTRCTWTSQDACRRGKWARAPDDDGVSVDAALWWLQSPLAVKNLKVLLVPPSPGQVLVTPTAAPPTPPTHPLPSGMCSLRASSEPRAHLSSFSRNGSSRFPSCLLLRCHNGNLRRLPRPEPELDGSHAGSRRRCGWNDASSFPLPL